MNNLRQLGIAAHNHESAKKSFPFGRRAGFELDDKGQKVTIKQWGHLAHILPYSEETSVHDLVDFKASSGTSPAKFVQVQFFLCPSDTSDDRMNIPSCWSGVEWKDAGRTNYHGNGGGWDGRSESVGDLLQERNNGIFVTNLAVKMRHITDGTSHTALYSEAVRGDGDNQQSEVPGDWFRISSPVTGDADADAQKLYEECNAITDFNLYKNTNQFSCRGRNWVHGDYTTTRYNHLMPPNKHGCSRGTSINAIPINEEGGATTASSRHRGGVNTVYCDGSAQFVVDDIDYLVWRAMGSRNGGEVFNSN
jgi:prepilin-type processing-associated H-X9-DG protein